MKFQNTLAITQWGYGEDARKTTLYIFTVDAELLAGKSVIFKRTPERREGYQRVLASKRLGKGKEGIAGYLMNQMGVFPTSVLVNVREEDGKASFSTEHSISEEIEVGELALPDGASWYVVDGQHRIEGLKATMAEEPEFKAYPMAVTLTNENVFYEMLMFYMVNSRQRSVPTDLAYRIIQRAVYDESSPTWARLVFGSGADRRKAIAATVVDFLNAKDSSPFKEKIREVGEVEKPTHLVRDGQFIKYVALILRERTFSDMLDEEIADLLAKYWTAIRKIYPAAFRDPGDYLLLATLGLSSLNRLFPVVYAYCALEGEVSQRNMEKYLGYLLQKTETHRDPDFIRPVDERWWHRVDGPGIVHGTGEGHYQRVSENLAEKIGLVIKRKRVEK